MGTQFQKCEWYYSDNGFSSLEAMTQAHRAVVDAACAVLNGTGGSIIDLGCGNGVLVCRIAQRNGLKECYGVDLSARCIEHARVISRQRHARFLVGDLFSLPMSPLKTKHFRMALIMPGRMLEVEEQRALQLRSWLRDHSDVILGYAYGDWIGRYGDLSGLAAATGFRALNMDQFEQAGVVQVIQ